MKAIQITKIRGSPNFAKSAKLYRPGPMTNKLVWYAIGVANEQFAAKITVRTIAITSIPVCWLIAKAIGVNNSAAALLEIIFVNRAMIKNTADNRT